MNKPLTCQHSQCEPGTSKLSTCNRPATHVVYGLHPYCVTHAEHYLDRGAPVRLMSPEESEFGIRPAIDRTAEIPTCAWQSLEDGAVCGDKASHIVKDGGAVYCPVHAKAFGMEHLRLFLPRDYPNGVIDARRTGHGNPPVEPSDRFHVEQLRQEINNIIQRYGQESDLNYVETFGVLEMCKLDFAERIRQSGNDEPEEAGQS